MEREEEGASKKLYTQTVNRPQAHPELVTPV
jgi:hypothetical protein